jgi:hypothetical protein
VDDCLRKNVNRSISWKPHLKYDLSTRIVIVSVICQLLLKKDYLHLGPILLRFRGKIIRWSAGLFIQLLPLLHFRISVSVPNFGILIL